MDKPHQRMFEIIEQSSTGLSAYLSESDLKLRE